MKRNVLTSLALIVGLSTGCQYEKKIDSPQYEIAYTSRESGEVEIYMGETDGQPNIENTNQKGGYIAWSPEGNRIAFYAKYDERKTWSIHTMNRDGTDWKRLTYVKDYWDNSPTWSPDGNEIVFARAYRDTTNTWHHEIWNMNADGTNQHQIEGIEGGGGTLLLDGQ